jgi:small nuclear ribonucleoprotein (snRNP)-like protein
MKNEKEFTGKLLGFDDYVSKYSIHAYIIIVNNHIVFLDMVLEDVTEL